uniref:G-protein coupled receptors family 1 profile domain-containing protein n=1 Tax=Ornithorhynchus anatinus TaxID=9258 RepID=F7CP52_ORNAN
MAPRRVSPQMLLALTQDLRSATRNSGFWNSAPSLPNSLWLDPTESVTQVAIMGNTGSHQGDLLANQTSTTKSTPLSFESCQLAPLVLFLLVVAYALVVLVGLLGNLSLIIIITRKQKETQNVTNALIANLSLSDILMCVVCIPFTMVYTLMDHWIFGDAMCKVTAYAQSVSVTVSIFSLVLIAIERHQLIVNPRGWKPNMSQACCGLLLAWIFSLLMSVPFFLFSQLTDEPFRNISLPGDPFRHRAACVEEWPSRQGRLVFTTSLLGVQYCVPWGFISVCYLKILLCLRKRHGKVERVREQESRRVNSMLISIVVTFGACWLPLNIFNIIFDWNHEILLHCHHDLVFILCHLAAMTSTCINPLFYGFLNKNFQKDLMDLLHLCRCFAPRDHYDSIAISTLPTEESKVSVKFIPSQESI